MAVNLRWVSGRGYLGQKAARLESSVERANIYFHCVFKGLVPAGNVEGTKSLTENPTFRGVRLPRSLIDWPIYISPLAVILVVL